MMKNLRSFFYLLVLVPLSVAGQQDTVKTSKSKLPEKPEAVYKPKIGIGAGIFTYFGEVRDNSFSHILTASMGFDLTVSRNISNSFVLDLRVIYGNLSVNERGPGNNYNFRTELWNGSANLIYNFAGLYNRPRAVQPFIGAGVAYMNFNSKTDLLSAQGIQYHYWSDGSIRSLDQADVNAEDAVIVQRDYEYETDLREQNLDGLGKYKQYAVSIPVSAGLNFRISNRVNMKLSTTYFYNFTDLIDNVSDAGEGSRKGNSAKDNFLFSSFLISYALWSEEPFSARRPINNSDKYKLPRDYYDNVDFSSVDDLDNDKVTDDIDDCPDTPEGTLVNEKGCPKDTDGDGVPDYKDKEINTPSSNATDSEGVSIPASADEEFQALKPFNRKDVNNTVSQAATDKTPKSSSNYTVQVGAYGKNVPTDIRKKLEAIPGIQETKLNDTMTVFTLGSYKDFEEAEKMQNQLIQGGLNDAFGLKENRNKEVTGKLDNLIKTNPDLRKQYKNILGADVIAFKVQTEEYRGEFDIAKFKDVITKYGMQKQTTPGGLNIYTFGSFDNYNDAHELQEELTKKGIKKLKVKSYLNDKAISVEDALEFFDK